MGLRSNPRKSDFSSPLVLFFVLFAVSCVSAQESGAGADREESIGSIKDLGRRSKIFVDKLKANAISEENDPESVGVSLNLGSGLGTFDAFVASLSMIIVSEIYRIIFHLSCDPGNELFVFISIGDETFIIAALMAMRHPKSIVLSGALSALFVMTVLSTGLGRIVPNLISRKHTNSAATGFLFHIFFDHDTSY
ncbi:unnamed protein product [Ilex paraguariensis]|uniref:GDT1 family protein n=1 Tax=Ilex paraguariensis TaxID=185542 RepID=A0ABC8TCD0_9AQUA